jgi:Cyclin, N-terminal domain
MVQRDIAIAANNKQKSFFGIRLSRKATIPLSIITSYNETCELITVLQRQDLSYQCQDYLNSSGTTDTDSRTDATTAVLEHDIDIDCREKMIEWCYRVCDCGIFPCDREMVAIATSYLDRYMMKLHQSSSSSGCDRPTFKLAAVTSFYLATKIMSCMQIRIESLVDLGRGSFNGDDILQMEHQMLHLLEWRMNPPTTQCFIRQMWTLLPMSIRKVDSIYYRSIYFAELAVYEYEFVSNDRCVIAVACILNAIISQQFDIKLLETTNEMNVLYDFVTFSKNILERKAVLRSIQCRLWYLYSCSAQVSEDIEQLDISVVLPKYSPPPHRSRNGCDDTTLSLSSRHSPVSVQHDNSI